MRFDSMRLHDLRVPVAVQPHAGPSGTEEPSAVICRLKGPLSTPVPGR